MEASTDGLILGDYKKNATQVNTPNLLFLGGENITNHSRAYWATAKSGRGSAGFHVSIEHCLRFGILHQGTVSNVTML